MNRPSTEKIKEIVEQCRSRTRCDLDIRYDEPMKDHTTFEVGGPADCWLRPGVSVQQNLPDAFPSFCASLRTLAAKEGIPFFILGGGANIVVSDNGIRGIVLDTGAWKGQVPCEGEFVFKSGTKVDEAVETAAAAGLCGLEFLAGMPGTIGGAVWMNARCYGSEIADVLSWAEIIDYDAQGKITRIFSGEGFGCKLSPFQKKDCLILSAAFKLKPGDKSKIYAEMEKNRRDRQEKGHYRYPCAGSAFKNNRDFGKPTGQIIDELGLKGLQAGGAQIAPFHANIIINTGNATAKDIRALVDKTAAKVKAAKGFSLEPEILFIGD